MKNKKKLILSEEEKEVVIEKYNNGVSMAELAVQMDTSIYQLRKLIPRQRRRGGWKTKLTEKDVNEIRSRLRQGEKMADIAASFSVSYSTISDISSRASWNPGEKIDGRKIARQGPRDFTLSIIRLLKKMLAGERLSLIEVAAVLRCRPEVIYSRLDLLSEAGYEIKKDEQNRFYLI